MIKRRPLGIILVAAACTIIGGFGILVVFVEALDSIRFYGAGSLRIIDFYSFAGFLIYAAGPVLSYMTGMGLFNLRPWAHFSVLNIIPVILFFWFINIACKEASQAMGWFGAPIGNLLMEQFSIFLKRIFHFLLISIPLRVYFSRLIIYDFFLEIE
ncbi:MAG: hypothetical protein KAR05_11245 [Candidatus Omnitrophica bacterium]|nr:hypothetical protein [Candidatus Omnitrophota bacterium]